MGNNPTSTEHKTHANKKNMISGLPQFVYEGEEGRLLPPP
jgi:hypothetical protein